MNDCFLNKNQELNETYLTFMKIIRLNYINTFKALEKENLYPRATENIANFKK